MSFYNEKQVNKGRKDKECVGCSEVIPKGTPHMVIPNLVTYVSYPMCMKCHKDFLARKIDTIELVLEEVFGDD